MGKTYVGVNGANYTIIKPALGKGGEGAIYKIREKSNLVLKVFNPAKRDETRHRKLLAMIKTPLSPNAMKQVTWPVDVVYENGDFVGYVMPLLKRAEDLNVVIFSDKYIYTLSEKITIAKNLCAAVNAIHEVGQVCGDLNPNNITVDPRTGDVTLVDTDSYDIKDPNTGTEYRCEVGHPEYIARELQERLQNNKGKDLRASPLPTFTKETDLFALAVHIFALLMNGCHPFACAIDINIDDNKIACNDNWNPFVSGANESVGTQKSLSVPQPIENIRNGFFPFYMTKSNTTTPLYAPDFDFLPKNLQEMFIRAFLRKPEDRPSAVEWFFQLQKSEKNLIKCIRNSGHEYFDHMQDCSLCELENKIAETVQIPNIEFPNIKIETPAEPHLACVLLLDTSASMMQEDKIKQLNESVQRFFKEKSIDELAQKRVDVAIIEFNEAVHVLTDFTSLCRIEPAVYRAKNGTAKAMCEAINLAIDKVKERNNFYNIVGSPHFPPEIIMFTDGELTDDTFFVSKRIKEEEMAGNLKLWCAAIPEYNINNLKQISTSKHIVDVTKTDFTFIFDWLDLAEDDSPVFSTDFSPANHQIPYFW